MTEEIPKLAQCERRNCIRTALNPSRFCCVHCIGPVIAGRPHTVECEARHNALTKDVVV